MDLDCKEVERLKKLVPYKILAPTPNEIINYIEKLQSNWNSLREWLEEDLKQVYRDCGHRNNIMRDVLDKMNELEKSDRK